MLSWFCLIPTRCLDLFSVQISLTPSTWNATSHLFPYPDLILSTRLISARSSSHHSLALLLPQPRILPLQHSPPLHLLTLPLPLLLSPPPPSPSQPLHLISRHLLLLLLPLVALSTLAPSLPASPPTQHERAVLHLAALGGLTAMLGLIAFALLVITCSYWKLSGTSIEPKEGDHSTRDRQDGKSDNNNNMSCDHQCHLELKHAVVIMVGEEKATFLATPIFSSRASSFEDRSNSTTKENENQNHA